MRVLVDGHLQGWFPLTGLSWNLPAAPYIFAGRLPTFDGTSSQAHLLGMSLKSLHIYCIIEVLLVQIGDPEPLETFPGYALIMAKSCPIDLKNKEEFYIKEKKLMINALMSS